MDKWDLSMVYTPGVGKCCTEINKNPDLLKKLTLVGNNMFILSNGSGLFEDY